MALVLHDAATAQLDLPELPCANCRVLIAEVFLVFVGASHGLPFAGEVCERCVAELEQEAAR